MPCRLLQYIAVSLILCGIPFLLQGCGSGSVPPLKLMTWPTNDDQAILRKQLTEFSLQNPKIKVELITCSTEEKCRSEFGLRSQQGRAPDVCMISSRDLSLWTERRYVRDLLSYQPELKRFIPEIAGAFAKKERLYALPCGWSTLMLYYNRALFERHGVPFPTSIWDWGDLLMAAQLLTVEDPETDKTIQFGLDVTPSVTMWAPFVWQNHGQLMHDDGRWVLADPQFYQSNVQAVEFYADLVREHHVAPRPLRMHGKLVQEGSFFIRQKAAMTIADRSLSVRLRGKTSLDWDVVSLPQNRIQSTLLSVYGFAMSSQSARQNDAWKLISFLGSETVQSAMIMNGEYTPSLETLVTSRIFLEFPGPRAIQNSAYQKSLASARLLPGTSLWSAAEPILNEEMTALMENPKATARETVEQMQARLDELTLTSRLKRK